MAESWPWEWWLITGFTLKQEQRTARETFLSKKKTDDFALVLLALAKGLAEHCSTVWYDVRIKYFAPCTNGKLSAVANWLK